MSAWSSMDQKFSHREPFCKTFVLCQSNDASASCGHASPVENFGENLKAARKAKGLTQQELAAEAGLESKGYVSDLETGKKPIPPGRTLEALATALDVRIRDLISEQVLPLVRVIGRVGANPDDTIIYTSADDAGAWAPLPPGGTPKAAAVEVVGHSMRWVAEDGSLIYFEQQRNPPSEDMLGDIVIVETEHEQVLVKRLLRGSRPKHFDLESQNGATLRDQRIVWAAEITAIIPPRQARRIIKRDQVA